MRSQKEQTGSELWGMDPLEVSTLMENAHGVPRRAVELARLPPRGSVLSAAPLLIFHCRGITAATHARPPYGYPDQRIKAEEQRGPFARPARRRVSHHAPVAPHRRQGDPAQAP